jgi:hypothetical protein
MRRLLLLAFPVLLATGCSKAKVDAAYMSEIKSAVTAICKCTTLPKDQQVDCMGRAGSPHPKKGPGGEPPGIYEEKLDDASKSEIAAERAKWSSCESQIMQN